MAASATRHPSAVARDGDDPGAGPARPARSGVSQRRGGPDSPRDVLPGPAVLGADRLIAPGGHTTAVSGPVTVDQLAALVASGGARTVMVHPTGADPAALADPQTQQTALLHWERTGHFGGRSDSLRAAHIGHWYPYDPV